MGAALVADGRAVRLTTTGRRTGHPHEVIVSFVREDDGAILVGATDPDADWALNLLAEPRVRLSFGGPVVGAVADLLDAADHARAVAALILRHGTPSEGLGRGPTFRLRVDA